jgi:2-polyprenyl-6-methoxyphenol hydroxylase-like FAD-dependent oxidoreductase
MGKQALVVGAGIGGLAVARVLREAGFEVRILERSPEMEPLGAGITLWPNAVRALRAIGVAGQLPEQAPVDAESGLRRWDGKLLAKTDLVSIGRRYGEPLLLLQRGTLQRALLADGIADLIQTGAEAVRATESSGGARVELLDGEPVDADLVVGADGINSAVRASLLGDGPPRYSGLLCYRAIIAMPPLKIGVGEYWGDRRIFGTVPVDDGRLYWFATRLGKAEEPREADPIAGLLERHRGWAPEIRPVLEATPPDTVLRHPLLDRKPGRHWCGERTALLGDAAHPMLPFVGQGGCQALEDAAALGEALRTAADVPAALRAYEAKRRGQAARAVRMSRQMGKLIHLSGVPARAVRNGAIALTPETVRLRPLDPIVGRP